MAHRRESRDSAPAGPRLDTVPWSGPVLVGRVLVVILVVVLGGCRASQGLGPTSSAGAPDPAARAVVVSTEGCGFASATRGSGVAVGGELVLVSAHVVAGASEVRVDGRAVPVVSLDPDRDLALLRVAGFGMAPVPIADAPPGDTGRIVGAATSGTTGYRVVRVVDIDIDAVRRSGRSIRKGYELEAEIAPGDSGAGMYSGDGRLVGVVFGSDPSNDHRAWATAGTELADFIAEGPSGQFVCNRADSVLEPTEGR